jgi:hypothetical protein
MKFIVLQFSLLAKFLKQIFEANPTLKAMVVWGFGALIVVVFLAVPIYFWFFFGKDKDV